MAAPVAGVAVRLARHRTGRRLLAAAAVVVASVLLVPVFLVAAVAGDQSNALPVGAASAGGGVQLVGSTDLVDVYGIRVHRSIAADLATLLRHASADGITLAGWGWRSPERTAELRVINGCPDVYVSPASSCRTPTARPGSSMHERGLAVDFTFRGRTIGSRSSPAFRWLAANAAGYGLYNLPSEPWHWSTTGG